jgi:hypothetical protein
MTLQTGIEVSDGSEYPQPSAYSPLRIILMGLGIAKVHEEPIPQELGDMPIVALDNFGTHPLICTHHFPHSTELRGGGHSRSVKAA